MAGARAGAVLEEDANGVLRLERGLGLLVALLANTDASTAITPPIPSFRCTDVGANHSFAATAAVLEAGDAAHGAP